MLKKYKKIHKTKKTKKTNQPNKKTEKTLEHRAKLQIYILYFSNSKYLKAKRKRPIGNGTEIDLYQNQFSVFPIS